MRERGMSNDIVRLIVHMHKFNFLQLSNSDKSINRVWLSLIEEFPRFQNTVIIIVKPPSSKMAYTSEPNSIFGFVGYQSPLLPTNEKNIVQPSLPLKTQMSIVQSHFRFSISLNNFDEFNTPDITVGEVPWYLRIRKIIIDEENHSILQVQMICKYKDEPQTDNFKWWIEAGATFKLIAFNENNQSIEKIIPKKKFNETSRTAELPNFVSWEQLNDKKFNFIQMDEFTIEAMITASPLRKQIELSEFEQICTKFGFIIQNVKNLNFIDSPKTILRGTKWFFRFQKQNDALSIHLNNERSPENYAWSFEVNFSVKLLSFDDNIEPLEKRLCQRFDSDRNVWGWSNFIKWNDLIYKEKKYVHNNAFFEISIDVGQWKLLWSGEHVMLKNDPTLKCPICMEKYADGKAMTTACGHLFFGICIEISIEQHAKCPLCNKVAAIADLRPIFLQ